jgi:predicted AAA+ superfamily ATPase
MPRARIHPRFLAPRLREALADSPVVLVHGPRQSGKTTLAQTVGARRRYQYVSFDDDAVRAGATADPIGFVGGLSDRAILDEVQRVPSLFTALKDAVDRKRSPGRFILTGSANVLLLPTLADSLAGRMSILRLHPLAQSELASKAPTFLDRLFDSTFPIRTVARLDTNLAERIIAGGYPAALARAGARRAAWYRDYIETLVQRDVRDFSRIRSLDVLPRLLQTSAAYTAQLLNFEDLAGPFSLTRPTVQDYVTLLERVFLLERLPPWHNNRLSRLVKTPKLHMCDTGVASAMLGFNAKDLLANRNSLGHLLETFVFQELKRQASWRETPLDFFHYRDRDGIEVDIVVSQGAARLAGVEVKAAATVSTADFRGLRKLKDAAGGQFTGGVVLYDGETSVSFGDGLFAVPIRMLWE